MHTCQQNYINDDVCANGTPCTAGFGVSSEYNDGGNTFNRWDAVDGVSAEVIWRILNPLISPVGVGLYIEPTIGRLQDSLETKLIVQSNFFDDRLIVAGNLSFEMEREHYTVGDENIIRRSHVDLNYGANCRFTDNWSAGMEGHLHNDFFDNRLNQHIQFANFNWLQYSLGSQKILGHWCLALSNAWPLLWGRDRRLQSCKR